MNENQIILDAVEKLGIGFEGLTYDVNCRFGDDFKFGGYTGVDPDPKSEYFFHDLSHIVEYTADEFRIRTMKSGSLSFTIPWNDFFNCSEGFSKLSASLREARTIAIEMHIRELAGEEVNHKSFAFDSAISVVRFIEDSMYIKIDNEDLTQEEALNKRTDILSDMIVDFYNQYKKNIIAQTLKDRMKAISIYASKKHEKELESSKSLKV